jgi:hypothetical protein
MWRPLVLLSLVLVFAYSYASHASVIRFVDWITIDIGTDVAIGSLDTVSVEFTGSDIDWGVVNESWTGFDVPMFTPPIDSSDMVSFRGAPAVYHYTLTFSAPVEDPIMHLRTLASTLTFSTDQIVKLSGDSVFSVSDSVVSGVIDDDPPGYDANGTISFEGTFSTLSFTAEYPYTSEDGIILQVGAPWEASGITDRGQSGPVPQIRIFPNPGSRGTTIDFETSETCNVRARIHDVRGRSVCRLFDGICDKGYHVFQWHGCDDEGRIVPAGVYLLHLVTSEGMATERVVVLR